MKAILLCLLPFLSSFAKASNLEGSPDTFEGKANRAAAGVSTQYASPSAVGAHLSEAFDDPWMFERNWVFTKTSAPAKSKVEEAWSLASAPGAQSAADLSLTLASGYRHLSAGRLLSTPLDLSSRPLVVQFQLHLPRLQRCAGAQVRLLTDSYDLRLDQISHSTPFALMFGAERCAGQVKLQFGVRHIDSETGDVLERRAPPVSDPTPGDGTRRYRLLLPAGADADTARLMIDDQLLAEVDLRSLLEGDGRAENGAEESRDRTERLGGGRTIELEPAGAVSVDLWSTVGGLYLDNLIVTDSPEQADVFTPLKLTVQPTVDSSGIDIRWFLQYSSERPWMYPLLVLAIGIPACLLLSCCLPESLDLEAQRKKAEALRKKTDEQTEDEKTNGGSQRQGKVGGLLKSGQSNGRARLLVDGQQSRRRVRRD